MERISDIKIVGACENNLKNTDLRIPKNKLVVLTGVSDSGKSTIAFDTLQKECRRQYMESLGYHAERISKPKVKSITGLSPSISVDQRNINNNPRSTVGTLTEISSYLRLLYTKLGVWHCSVCGHEIKSSFQQAEYEDYIENSLEEEAGEESEFINCNNCGHTIKDLTPADMSFNKPQGACPRCSGLGYTSEIKLDELINEDLTIALGAVTYWGDGEKKMYTSVIHKAAKYYGFEFDDSLPLKDMNKAAREIICHGVESPRLKKWFPDIHPPTNIAYGRYTGAIPYMEHRLARQHDNDRYKKQIDKYLARDICPDCKGTRLNAKARSVLLNQRSIAELSDMSLKELYSFIKNLSTVLTNTEAEVFKSLYDSMTGHIESIINMGLGYLTLNRTTPSLSPGEYQRLRLALLLGSGLTGVLYVLDEPTVGLHPSDTQKLIKILKKLRSMGNTILVIEHDVDFMKAADYIIDIGPGGGKNGGQVVAAGSPEEIAAIPNSITGFYLKEKEILPDHSPREGNGSVLRVLGAYANNLKNIDIDIPLNEFVVLSGVSGAGKSSLVFDVIAKAAHGRYDQEYMEQGQYEEIKGWESIDSVIIINQAPMGRVSRSNVLTYTDIFTSIRKIYAKLPLSIERGYKAERFSFNTAGGRCERCQGSGTVAIHMSYQEPVEVRCPSCRGRRYKKEMLDIKYKGINISDIFELTIEEALELFHDIPGIRSKLTSLVDVGVDYLRLGQTAPNLSGGEAQRIKLSKELEKHKKGHILYLLDEPTKGLHPHDTQKLLRILHKLVDQGNSVIVIEHNTDVIKTADYIIEMGPEGGNDGGRIVAAGTLSEIINCEVSATGNYFRERLN